MDEDFLKKMGDATQFGGNLSKLRSANELTKIRELLEKGEQRQREEEFKKKDEQRRKWLRTPDGIRHTRRLAVEEEKKKKERESHKKWLRTEEGRAHSRMLRMQSAEAKKMRAREKAGEEEWKQFGIFLAVVSLIGMAIMLTGAGIGEIQGKPEIGVADWIAFVGLAVMVSPIFLIFIGLAGWRPFTGGSANVYETPYESPILIDKLLEACVKQGASEIHLSPGQSPVFRLRDRLRELETTILESEDIVSLMKKLHAPERCQLELQKTGSSDFRIAYADKAQFRVSIFKQSEEIRMVLRVI
ncbi:hypothetical protein N9Z44_01080 [Mariniblastus sp.]|nr:hypothetical protein [Mariniblastus sp.]